jgi:UDP-N-acetylglucosamine 2-epimerase (non-hydrolysing)
LLISLNGTEQAIDYHKLRVRIEELRNKYDNFLYSPVWPFYTDVIAAMEKATVCATDSGSMQEEMNYMGIPCVTLRFNSDRPESAICGGNLIAPPINKKIVVDIIKSAEEHADKLRNAPKIYGTNPSKKIIDGVKGIIKDEKLFRWEHERLGYNKSPFWMSGEMRW